MQAQVIGRRPQKGALAIASIPAPTGGVNTVAPGGQVPPTDCLAMYNLVSSEYGVRSRLGYTEWATGLGGEARTILPFTGSQSSGARLFVATAAGIYNVSSSTATPAKVLTFATPSGNAGWGVYTSFVNAAGTHFLLYCDEVNGYHVYSEASGLWAAIAMGGGASQISGVDPTTFVFVTVWKNRVWFVERNTARGWYLDINALYGAATSFNFGVKFKAGGYLVGLWSWTQDGGAGIDDSLVAVSAGGDVAIYQGTDPSDPTAFGLRGVWYVGAVPTGRRIASDYGGDLLILSTVGIVMLSKLVVGVFATEQYATDKVANIFNLLMLDRRAILGWSLRIHPEDNTLIATVPGTSGGAGEQLVMSLATHGWSRYRDLPMYCAEVWSGKLYFGTSDGRVCRNEGYIDNVRLANTNTYDSINYSLLTAFQGFGNGRQKLVRFIRPTVLAQSSTPAYDAQARYNYDLSEIATAPTASAAAGWDVGTWDVSTWGADYTTSNRMIGATGAGNDIAVAMRGIATSRTILTGFDVFYEEGGPL